MFTYKHLKEGWREDGVRLQWSPVRGPEAMGIKWNTFPFIARVTEHWQRWLLSLPFLELLKSHLDTAWFRWPCLSRGVRLGHFQRSLPTSTTLSLWRYYNKKQAFDSTQGMSVVLSLPFRWANKPTDLTEQCHCLYPLLQDFSYSPFTKRGPTEICYISTLRNHHT